MTGEKGKSILSEFENRFGLPRLSQVAETLEKFPDEKKLKSIKEILTLAERVSKTALELDKVISLIRELNSISPEKLSQLERILRRIEKIMKTAPEGILEFISSLSDEEKFKL